jgi:recombinase/recombinase-like zinc beta ribbon protein
LLNLPKYRPTIQRSGLFLGRHVVRLVFAKFAEIGTVQGVMRYLVEQGIEIGIRMRSGSLKGEVVWKRPARATITCMLHSPIYAGIYAYGRRRVDPMRQRPGHPGSGLRGQAEDEWLARIEGALPAYISVEQYRANLARLAANDPRAGTPGAVRYDPALLAGLLRCGRCARRMTVTYHVDNGVPRISYDCTGARAEYGGPACQHLSGRCLDVFVTGQVLAALSPPPPRSACGPPSRSSPTVSASRESGGCAWNAPRSTSTGPGAVTGWPNRKTAWWSGAGKGPGSRPRRPAAADR